ncbi:MAG: oligosaccharide flippase family protein [Halobacteriaceae archaeon]
MTEDESILGNLTKGSAIVLLGTVIGAGASFGSRIISAQYLGPEYYGSIIISIVIFNLSSLISLLGVPEGITQRLPRGNSKKSLFIPAVTLTLVLSISISIIIILFRGLLAGWLGDQYLNQLLLYVAVGLPFLSLSQMNLGAMRYKNNSLGKVISQNIFYQGGTLAGVTIVVTYQLEKHLILASWITSSILSAIVSTIIITRTTNLLSGISLANANFFTNRMKNLLAFSVPLVISNSLWVLMQQSDNLIIGALSNVTMTLVLRLEW